MKRYVEAFNLNILHGSWVEASSFNTLTKTWKINLCTPFGPKTVKAKHLVQATGVGSATPYVPEIPGAETYKGVNIHSVEYKNPTTLTDKGAKVSKEFWEKDGETCILTLVPSPVRNHHRVCQFGL